MEVINTQQPPTEPPDVQMEGTQQPDAATGQAETTDFIATEAEIEAWVAKPLDERQLTERLRGVLSETALTGVVRYSWTLMRPIVEFALDEMMREYEAAEAAETVGPPRPAKLGESTSQTILRFKRILGQFNAAPWTIQRVCELLQAPRNQYTQLHKVAMAVEKCLLVTSEVGVTPDAPPPPRLTDLHGVNLNPAAVQGPQAGGPATSAWNEADRGVVDPVAEASRAFTSSLIAIKHDAGAGAAAPGASDAAAGADGSAGGQAGDLMQGALGVAEWADKAAAAGGSGEEGPTTLGAGAAAGTPPGGGSPGLAAAGAGAPTPPAAGVLTAASGAAAAVAAATGVVGASPPASPERVGVAHVGALGSPKQHLANGPLLPNGALHGSSPGRSTSPGSPARHTPTSTHTARASPTRGSPGGTPHPPSPMEEDHWPDTPMLPRGAHMHGAMAHMHNLLSGAPASPVHMHSSLSGAPASPVHALAAAVGSQPHPPGSPGAGAMPGSPKALAHGPHSLLAMAQGAHTPAHAHTPMPTQLQQPQPASPVYAPAAAHQHGLLLPTAPDAPASGSSDAGAGRGDGEGAQQPAAHTAPQPPPPAPS